MTTNEYINCEWTERKLKDANNNTIEWKIFFKGDIDPYTNKKINIDIIDVMSIHSDRVFIHAEIDGYPNQFVTLMDKNFLGKEDEQ